METQSVSTAQATAPSAEPVEKHDPSFEDKVTEFLIKHRWATVVPIVLPLSKAYDTYWRARNIYYRNWKNTAHLHRQRVEKIQAAIQRWNADGRKGRLCTSRAGWQTVSSRLMEYKKEQYTVDVDLHDILEIDTEKRTVRVEPRVNMGQLTEALVPMGWTVPVVPELDDLTASGLTLGYGIESSAHKYGLFADTVVSAEVVLADGSVVTCSKTENADLFYALPWSYGALGFVTALELPIIPCKPYVRMTYEPVRGREEIIARFEELICADDPPEFMETLFYTEHEGVLIYGDFADLPAHEKPNELGRWYKPWFYKHAETCLESGKFCEYVPLRDYYHRHTRSLYWHGELLVPFGNTPQWRYPLGWLMPPKVSFLKLTQTESFKRYRDERNVVQDALVPIRHLREGIELFNREFECFPLWICGHKVFKTEPGGMLQPSPDTKTEEMFVDIGAWQVPGFVKRGEKWNGRQAVRNMEAWLREHNGYQCLYADTEQTREEFWQMFHRDLYEEMRTKYKAEGAFMDVFDKVKRPEME